MRQVKYKKKCSTRLRRHHNALIFSSKILSSVLIAKAITSTWNIGTLELTENNHFSAKQYSVTHTTAFFKQIATFLI